MPTRRARHDYRIAWICALPVEMAAAEAMLDETHDQLPNARGDRNAYILGSIGAHKIVITCLPAGIYGTSAATTTATQMRFSYESIQCCFLVGIGGGAPSSSSDIRLGDVVVSEPTTSHGGVIQYDHGKALHGGQFVRTGTSDKPPEVLLKALNRLKARHMVHGSTVDLLYKEVLRRYPNLQGGFGPPSDEEDRLFLADYRHEDSASSCEKCNATMVRTRTHRPDSNPRVFYGLIASANQVVRDANLRDRLSRDHGILCFEMEAAGLMNIFPCLVVRGICHYSDSHRNKKWQGYAAIIAAAYVKEFMLFLSWQDSKGQLNIGECLIQDPLNYAVRSLFVEEKDLTLSDLASNPSPPSPLPQRVTSCGISSESLQVKEQKSDNDETNKANPSSDQEHCTDGVISQQQPQQQFDEAQSDRKAILEALDPDFRAIFQTNLSMARAQRSWHPWPGDCVNVFNAMKGWLATEKSSLLILNSEFKAYYRMKDLVVEVIQFLIEWKEEKQGKRLSNYQVFWSLHSTEQSKPTESSSNLTERNSRVQALRSLITSIIRSNPEVLNESILVSLEIQCPEEALWQLLLSILSHTTNAFVVVECKDPLFISSISHLIIDLRTKPGVKFKFLLAYDCMISPSPLDHFSDKTLPNSNDTYLVQVQPPPPQSRKILGRPRRDCDWKVFTPCI